jgi:hypothetical protein
MDEFRELLSTYRKDIAGLPRQTAGTSHQVAQVISKISVTHTDAEHWENISRPFHKLFGWDNELGILSNNSARADHEAVLELFEQIAKSEDSLKEGESCLTLLSPRLRRACAYM